MTGQRVDGDVPPPALHDDQQALAAAGFEILGVIAAGSQATVYRASQPDLRRTVAVRLQHQPMSDPAVRRRFAEQCAVLGRLGGHPNIVETYGCAFNAAGRPYVVLELPPGGSLGERLRRGEPLAWPQVLEMAVALSDALATAHRAGVVHGDVRVDNVLVSAYGPPKLGGFARFDEQPLPAGSPDTDVRDLAAVCVAALHDQTAPPSLRRLLTQVAAGGARSAEAFGQAAQRVGQRLGVAPGPLALRRHGDRAAAARARRQRRRTRAAGAAALGLVFVAAVLVIVARGENETLPPARPVPLDITRVAGEWQHDEALAEQLTVAPDAYLCREPAAAPQAQSLRADAYRSAASDARVGVVVRTLAPAAAEELLDDVAGQATCLEQLPGLTEVAVQPAAFGDQAVRLQYRRSQAQAPVEIVVLVVRREGTVGEIVHLGYPRTVPGVTRDLHHALDAAVGGAG